MSFNSESSSMEISLMVPWTKLIQQDKDTGGVPMLTPTEIKELELKFLDSKIPDDFCGSSSPNDCPYRLLAFDIETNKLGDDAEIVQLAVVDCNVPSTNMSLFCLPSWMDSGASKVTGLRLVRPPPDASVTTPTLVNGKGETLSTVPLKECLTKFTEFVHSYKDSFPVLVAHNGHSFDFPILINQFAKAELPLPNCMIADTLKAARTLRQKPNPRVPERLRLCDLVAHFQPQYKFDAHDALADCLALRSILLPWDLPPTGDIFGKRSISSLSQTATELMELSESMHIVNLQVKLSKHSVSNKVLALKNTSLLNSHISGGLSKAMQRKISQSGFSIERLHYLAIHGGWRSFAGLLASVDDRKKGNSTKSKPRVSAHKPTLVKLYEHFGKKPSKFAIAATALVSHFRRWKKK